MSDLTFDVDGFKQWLVKKSGPYDYGDNYYCPIAQFYRQLGYDEVSCSPKTVSLVHGIIIFIPSDIERAVSAYDTIPDSDNRPSSNRHLWTFEALRKRLFINPVIATASVGEQ